MTTDFKPHLTWDIQHDCWCLTMPRFSDEHDVGYCMLIDHSHNWRTENNYIFIRNDIGDEMEVVTTDQYMRRLDGIEEHEGEAVRKAWHEGQTYVRVERDNHPVFALKQYFEAIMTLEIVSLAVTYGIKNQPSASKELRAKLDAIHHAEQLEINEMIEAFFQRS